MQQTVFPDLITQRRIERPEQKDVETMIRYSVEDYTPHTTGSLIDNNRELFGDLVNLTGNKPGTESGVVVDLAESPPLDPNSELQAVLDVLSQKLAFDLGYIGLVKAAKNKRLITLYGYPRVSTDAYLVIFLLERRGVLFFDMNFWLNTPDSRFIRAGGKRTEWYLEGLDMQTLRGEILGLGNAQNVILL